MKERLDIVLVNRGLTSSRQRAKYLIEGGFVEADGKTVTKAGFRIEDNANITVTGQSIPFVSRGGLKLAKALDVFPVSVSGRVCLDLGASTGGFTDCLLQHGASLVYAVDSGHGQLDISLAGREDVINLEGINGKELSKNLFPVLPQIVTIDVSFISLQKVLPSVKEVSDENAEIICLVKPQFEAGRANIGKHGVVKDRKIHIHVLQEITKFADSIGLVPNALDFSPVKGPEGNIEYLLYLRKNSILNVNSQDIVQTVEKSHQVL